MIASEIRWFALSALLGVSALVTTGCYADIEEPVAVEGYAPQYYDGYVVYYDGYGRPFDYNRGGVYYVPNTYVGYNGLVAHYRAYGVGYARWHASYGARYRSYRRR